MFVHAPTCCLDAVRTQQCRACWDSPAASAASAVSPKALGSKTSQSNFQTRFQNWAQGTLAVEFISPHICYVCNNSNYYNMWQALS